MPHRSEPLFRFLSKISFWPQLPLSADSRRKPGGRETITIGITPTMLWFLTILCLKNDAMGEQKSD
jgi:hypothetical protein